MKWLAANQITLKSEILTPDIIVGLRSDTLPNTKQYFYLLLALHMVRGIKELSAPKNRKIS